MTDQTMIGKSKIQLRTTDITDLEVEAFVFYAREDLDLGSGFGTAISLRGGASVKEELKQIGSAEPTQAVITSAGGMKAKYIVHAVGPKFQEEELEAKLAATVRSALVEAGKKGITQIALPAMGAGFYGIPIETSAKITVNGLREYLEKDTTIKEVVLCMLDSKQFKAFQQCLAKVNGN